MEPSSWTDPISCKQFYSISSITIPIITFFCGEPSSSIFFIEKLLALQTFLAAVANMWKLSVFSSQTNLIFSETSSCISFVKIIFVFSLFVKTPVNVESWTWLSAMQSWWIENAKSWFLVRFVLIIKYGPFKNNRLNFQHKGLSPQFFDGGAWISFLC